MKRDGKLTDVQSIVQWSDRQKNKNWKSMGVKSLILSIIVLGLVSCASSKPTPTPSVEVTPSPTPTPSIKPSASPKPKPKPSAAAPRSETDASQSAGGTSDRYQASDEEAQPEYTPKNKAIQPAEKPQPTVIKPAPAVEPAIDPEPRMQNSIPPVQTTPTQMAPIAPQPDSDPEPPPAR